MLYTALNFCFQIQPAPLHLGGGGGIDGNAQANAGPPALAPNQPREVKPLQTVPRIYLCSRTHSQLHQLVGRCRLTLSDPRRNRLEPSA